MDKNHADYMKLALNEAREAGKQGEVPVGAVVIANTGAILAAAHNQAISLNDPTAHAEISALRRAGKKLGNYRLLNTTLYVTIEPCIMCMGAIVHARVSRVVFGTEDPKWGAAGSLYNFANDITINHRPEIIRGVCRDECRSLIQEFFQGKRN